MRRTALITTVIALAASLTFAGTPSEQLPATQWGGSHEDVHAQLEPIADRVDSITIASPRLPLARASESYLIAHNLTTRDEHTIDRVTYTFADDALVMITASGNAIAALIDSPRDLPHRIGAWRISEDFAHVMHRPSDTVTLLSEDAQHPHLFLWQTPKQEASNTADINATIPPLFEFGAERSTIEPALKALCTTTTREQIDPPSLPTQPKRQTQVNAFGFEYAGAPRKVEAVFADDKLTLVWILTGKGEEGRLREALTQAYGQPDFVSDTIEAFNGWTVALRKDKPEVVAVAPELVPMMKAFFGG